MQTVMTAAEIDETRKDGYNEGHRDGFEAGKKFAGDKIAWLEETIKNLEYTLASEHEDWETLAYRHLRDTANWEEIEYVFGQRDTPYEIDRKMRAIVKDIYPDPGYTQP